MSLSFQDLQKALETTSGDLKVDAGTLHSDSITSLLGDFLDGTLRVRPERPATTGTITVGGQTLEAVIVVGTLASKFLMLPELKLNAQFYLLAGVAEMRITFTMPDPWRLSSSFPSLLNSDADKAELRQCLFQVDSLRPDRLGADFDALFVADGTLPRQPLPKNGLTLTAQLRLASVEETLTEFIAVPTGLLNLQGPVEVTVGSNNLPRPRMRLSSTADLADFVFENLRLKLGYQFATAPVPAGDASLTQQIRQRLTTPLAYTKDQQTLKVPLGITFAPNSLNESFIIELDKLDTRDTAVSLTTLAGLLPGGIGDMVQQVPGFPSVDQLKLTELRFELAGNPLEFSAVQARVQVGGQWEVVPKLVVFEAVALDFTVTRYNKGWHVRPYVLGTFQVAGGRLTSIFDLSTKAYFCMLEDHEKVDLKKLFTETLGQGDLFPESDKFDLTTFEIRGDLQASMYALDIGTTIDIPIDLGVAKAKIRSLFFSLEYVGKEFSGRLGGSLDIAGVTVAIAASYDKPSWWTFETAVYDLRLTDLLAHILGDSTLASKLPDVKFPHIDFTVTPRTKAFRFEAIADIQWPRPFGVDGTFDCQIVLKLEGAAVTGIRDPTPPVICDIKIDGHGSLKINETDLKAQLNVHATNGNAVSVTLNSAEKPAANPLTITAGGELVIVLNADDEIGFGLKFHTNADSKRITAYWPAKNDANNLSLDFKALATHFGMDMTHVPDALVPTLEGVTFDYDFAASQLLLAAHTTHTKVVFLTSPISNGERNVAGSGPGDGATVPRFYAFLLSVEAHVTLSSLPLIGAELASFSDMGVDGLLAAVTSEELEKDNINRFNKLIADAHENLPTLPLPGVPGQNLPKGGLIALNVLTGGVARSPLMFYLNDGANQRKNAAVGPDGITARALPSSEGAGANGTSGEAWLDVQRSFGPVNIKRIGIGYSSPNVVLMFDAALVLSGLALDMEGMSLEFPFKDPLNHITPNLRGMSLTYQSGPLQIGGGFVNVRPAPTGLNYEYRGELLIQAKGFGLAAIGSFAELTSGQSSLFLFGVLNATLGGPAFFIVTGIAAGFGYNRSLTLPTLDKLPEFPLIAAAMGTSRELADAQKAQDAAAALKTMDTYVHAAVGENWLAAGIKFTSFKILESFALLTVSFGNRFEIALLGLSNLTMPPLTPPSKAVGFAQLALEASFAPDDGVLKVAAQLTPESYILSQKCHLTGGFALYTWFKDEVKDGKSVHAGDFVVSLGGYSPYFTPPAQYPSVPRVGANWQVSHNLTIKGGLYFALTPVAVMAGGALDANFESGNFKAWFNAKIDFLLYWEPFHYLADLSLSLGASYTLGWWTITVHIGVEVTLHGPEFGGTMVLNLYVFSVTITFGPEAKIPDPLDWDAFETHFLPPVQSRTSGGKLQASSVGGDAKPTDSICFSRAGSLIKELPASSNVDSVDWIVNPETFFIVTSSAIPCSDAALNNESPSWYIQPLLICEEAKFGVTPCGIANGGLKSKHTVTWTTKDGGPVAWSITPVTNRMPRAAWHGKSADDLKNLPTTAELNGDRVTGELTTGFILKPLVKPADKTLPIKVCVLTADPKKATGVKFAPWSVPDYVTNDTFDQEVKSRWKTLANVSAKELATKRKSIAAALERHGTAVGKDTNTQYLKVAATNRELLDAPALRHLGEMKIWQAR